MKHAIVAKKNCLLINFWRLILWISVKYERYRFSACLGFDPHPNEGWANNEKNIPGFSIMRL